MRVNHVFLQPMADVGGEAGLVFHTMGHVFELDEVIDDLTGVLPVMLGFLRSHLAGADSDFCALHKEQLACHGADHISQQDTLDGTNHAIGHHAVFR